MKLRNGIILVACLLGMSNIQAHKIDPIEDFRYPESLFEIAHEGIVHVMYMIRNHGHHKNIMQHAFDSLHDIQDQFDVATRYHATPIKDEDREFLSSMIDRLESSVDSLHGHERIRSEIIDACEYLRDKIMQQRS